MRTVYQCILAMVFCWLIASVASAESFLTTALHCDAYFDNGSPETKGVEFSFPVELRYTRNLFSARIRGAYSSVMLDPGDDDAITFSAFTDMILESSYTYAFPNRPFAAIVNLYVNIPTGKERLSQEERQAEVGNYSDIFLVDDFGEGLNVGLTLGLERQLFQGSVGMYGGYTYNGEFDPTSDVDDDTLDPGDEVFILGLFDWEFSPAFELHSYLGYSFFLADQENGMKDFQEGEKLALGGAVRATFLPVTTLLQSRAVIQRVNSEYTGDDTLERESSNSNGFQWSGTAEVTYAYHPQLDLKLLGDLRYYGESERTRAISGLPYEGRRFRYAVGPGFTYRRTRRFSIQGTATYFSMEQQPDINQAQELTYHGLSLELGGAYQF